MKKSRITALGALAATLAFTTACYTGPACGCGSEETGTETEPIEPVEPLQGAAGEALEACAPRSWDIAVPADLDATLTVLPDVVLTDAGHIVMTIEVGGEISSFAWSHGEAAPTITVDVPAGELVAVHFAADVPAELDWAFTLDALTADDGVLVTEFEDPEAPVPPSCP